MLSTSQSTPQSTPTTSESARPTTQSARVTLQVALVAEVVVDVEVAGDDAISAARSSVLDSPARAAWDEVSLAAARALLTTLIEREPAMAVGLRVMRFTADGEPELLVQQMPEEQG